MTDPEAQRLLVEASLASFELVRYMTECQGKADSRDIAEKVLRYQAEVLAARGVEPGEHVVSVGPEVVLLCAQLANIASASFAAMAAAQHGRALTKAELSAQLAQYQETLLLGGSL